MTIRILEKWDLPTPVAKHNEWFADWALRRPNEVSRHITMGYHALAEVHKLGLDIRSIHESFGGIGAQAHVVEEFWPEAMHSVCDYSDAAVRYLIATLPLRFGLYFNNVDSYDRRSFVIADLQIADVGDLTAVRWDLEPYRQWLDHIFSGEAKAVVLTDIAGRLLHLHRANYSRSLGVNVWSYEQYLRAVGKRAITRYGYFPYVTFHHRWSAITVFTRDPTLHGILSCPTTPRGLEIL